MPAKPMIDDLELQQVQNIEAEEKEAVSTHSVPALDGDFLQDLGRRAVRVTLNGVLTGTDAGDGLKNLREKYQAAAVVPFVADIATATSVDKMLIESMDVRELAGKPERFEYAVALREFIPPPEQKEEPPPPPPPEPEVKKARLKVEVIVDGQPGFDFSTVKVTVGGTKTDGSKLDSRTLKNRKDNVWTEEDFPAGQYTAQAVTDPPTSMSNSADGKVQAGQETTITIHLTPGGTVVVAQTFVVHFEIDKAFVEPCMRKVLSEAAKFAGDNPTTKLLVSGNTDLVGTPGAPTGSDPYNQSLSERRARAIFAFITFGRDPEPAVTEWQELRKGQTPPLPTINDKWGTRQVQFMLQDLGFYPGAIDGKDGPLTQEAIRAFRCHMGLPPGTTMDDPTWDALIREYLKQDSFAIPESQFFANCPGEILKWTGCASQDPQKNIRTAWRPNRRVELLFVHAAKLPCDIPQPDTFELPLRTSVGTGWCVGPGDKSHRACFVVPLLPPGGQPKDKEWVRTPMPPGTITVTGSIKFDNGKPYAKGKFVLITPIGECKSGEAPDGAPVPAKTDDNGAFSFSGQPAGVYTLEVRNDTDVVVRLAEDDDGAAKGAIVCKELLADTDHLDVVILSAPVQREIKLPVVAHLMTALHPVTRAVRTCPAPLGPAQKQATAHSEDEISAAFAVANQIWQQARIHFELTDIVHETYSFKTDCEIDGSEFQIVLDRVADDIPDVVNVFFFGDLAGTGEAGFGISVEAGAGDGIAGCAVGDRFQFTALGPPIDVPLDDKQTAQVLAHELGHYLNLPHVTDNAANADRLMLPGTATGDNRKLDSSEVKLARASRGANDDCVPLSLKVTGATTVGGTLSNRFIVIQGTAGPVKVDADIPDHMLAPGVGVLDMTGGDAGINNKQRTVSTATNAAVEVVATYTPAGGGTQAKRRAIITVSDFKLQVDGAVQIGGAASTTFVAVGNPGQPVTITATLAPAPFAIPSDLIVWTRGDEADDPQRRTVATAKPGPVTVSAQIAGVTKSVTINVVSVEIEDAGFVGKGQNTNIAVTITPSPLPAGLSLNLRLETTAPTGEARFASNNSLQTTISQTTSVAVRGVTESSAVNNIRFSALMGATVVAQRNLTVVAVTIADVVGIKVGETRDVQVTVAPSPLPAGALTAELKATSGTGSATFAAGGAALAIAQSGPVSVKGVTASSVVDNIRLSVRATKQTAALAQEDFTVLNKLAFFMKFEIWNEITHVFDPLPAGIDVDLMDRDPAFDDRLATQATDGKGRVLFSLPDFKASGEDTPDIFFKVHTNKKVASGHTLPDTWSTAGWKATDGTPGLQKSFSGVGMGTDANPIVFRVGLDFHIRMTYADERSTPAVNRQAATGTLFRLLAANSIKREIGVDAVAEAHGVLFDVEGGDDITFRVDFSIQATAIKLNRSKVSIPDWDTDFAGNALTSLGTQAAPTILNATATDHRNRALFLLKNLRELATFLFHLAGAKWVGFDGLTINFSSILTDVNGGIPFSWPVGTVQMPDGGFASLPFPHLFQWDRGTHIHEITHQVMWKELNFSSLDIAWEAAFGDIEGNHFPELLSNPKQALVEGWAEFFEAVFARQNTPPHIFVNVEDSHRNPKGPLGPPPQNQGEKVEGAFANGLWSIFQNQVVTAGVIANSIILESVNGDITVTNPWLLNPAVSARFLSMIWNPFISLKSASPQDATAMVAAIRAGNSGNAAVLAALMAELHAFNMGLP